MKRFLTAVLWLLFFIPSSVIADTNTSFQFALTRNETCQSISATYFFKSRHEKGDRGGRLNESNYGTGGDCYLSKGTDLGAGFTFHAPLSLRALTNSQFGPTLVAGPGIRVRSPQLWRLSGEVGFELPFIYYGIPKKQAHVYGFLPVFFHGVGFELWRMGPFHLGHVTIGQRIFGGSEKVKLFSLEWRKEF